MKQSVHNRLGPIITLISEGIRFGVIGLIATGIHIGFFIFFIETFNLVAVLSNLIAYSLGFIFGFFGHSLWTFKLHKKSESIPWLSTFIRFLAVSLFGLVLSTITVYSVVDIMNLHYLYSVFIMVTIIPVIIFILNKKWAFT